ncbi:protein-glutamate O-methyltransferase CheR [Candidatus Poribacteria bacterium]|nr:protein-glutamate O-methyltransferase CheR [Candidatus Poribacteria bacterium]
MIQTKVTLHDEEFQLLRDLIYNHSGIYFTDNQSYILENRLSGRVKAKNFTSFQQYYFYLKYDKDAAQEMREVMDLVTVKETYFFREEYQFQILMDELLFSHAQRKKFGNPCIRIWSAACSTGEEPYSLAMLFKERFMGRMKAEILATDINEKALAMACKGVYRRQSFRSMLPYFQAKYFDLIGDEYHLKNEVKKKVNFIYDNLISENRAFDQQVDVIFCRNVLIYFDQKAKKKAVANLHNALKQEGYLFLGHSESLFNITNSFQFRQFQNGIAYQKV